MCECVCVCVSHLMLGQYSYTQSILLLPATTLGVEGRPRGGRGLWLGVVSRVPTVFPVIRGIGSTSFPTPLSLVPLEREGERGREREREGGRGEREREKDSQDSELSNGRTESSTHMGG